jgi:hypothetical protein
MVHAGLANAPDQESFGVAPEVAKEFQISSEGFWSRRAAPGMFMSALKHLSGTHGREMETTSCLGYAACRSYQ